MLDWMDKVNSEFGRKPLKHNCVKVVSETKSIQGGWHETLWNQFPKHMMETEKPMGLVEQEFVPLRPIKEKKVRMHVQTKVARRKSAIVDHSKI